MAYRVALTALFLVITETRGQEALRFKVQADLSSCGGNAVLKDVEFQYVGKLGDGSRYYKFGDYHLYYDSDCDGPNAVGDDGKADWMITTHQLFKDQPYDHERDVDCDFDANTFAVASSFSKERPPANATWGIWCDSLDDEILSLATVEVVTKAESTDDDEATVETTLKQPKTSPGSTTESTPETTTVTTTGSTTESTTESTSKTTTGSTTESTTESTSESTTKTTTESTTKTTTESTTKPTTKPTTSSSATTTTASNKGEASSAVVFGGRQFLGSLMITIGTLVFYLGFDGSL